MDATNVLALHDERRGRPHLRRERYLAVQSSWATARRFTPRRRLRPYPLGRRNEFAGVATSRPWQKTAAAISLAEFPASPRMGCVRRQILAEFGWLPVDLVSRRQTRRERACREKVLSKCFCGPRRQSHYECQVAHFGRQQV